MTNVCAYCGVDTHFYFVHNCNACGMLQGIPETDTSDKSREEIRRAWKHLKHLLSEGIIGVEDFVSKRDRLIKLDDKLRKRIDDLERSENEKAYCKLLR